VQTRINGGEQATQARHLHHSSDFSSHRTQVWRPIGPILGCPSLKRPQWALVLSFYQVNLGFGIVL
jgi:hypothetical protein